MITRSTYNVSYEGSSYQVLSIRKSDDGGDLQNHFLWGRFTSSNQKSCCLRNGPTKWQDTLTGNIDAKAMAKVGKGTLIYWMHWIQLNSLNTLCSSWVFFASFQSCDHPQILKETLPLAALRPDILKISAALAAIDHRLANLGRYHRRWPWKQIVWVKCCWCCDLLCSMMRHVWRRVPLIRVVCLPVLCPVNRRCLHVKTSFVKTFWLLYCGSRKDGMSSCDFP